MQRSATVRLRVEGTCCDHTTMEVLGDDNEMCRIVKGSLKEFGDADNLVFRVAEPGDNDAECRAGTAVVSLKLVFQACAKYVKESNYSLPASYNGTLDGDGNCSVLLAFKAPQTQGKGTRRPSTGSSSDPAHADEKRKREAAKNAAFLPIMKRYGLFYEPGRMLETIMGKEEDVTGMMYLDCHKKQLSEVSKCRLGPSLVASIVHMQYRPCTKHDSHASIGSGHRYLVPHALPGLYCTGGVLVGHMDPSDACAQRVLQLPKQMLLCVRPHAACMPRAGRVRGLRHAQCSYGSCDASQAAYRRSHQSDGSRSQDHVQQVRT